MKSREILIFFADLQVHNMWINFLKCEDYSDATAIRICITRFSATVASVRNLGKAWKPLPHIDSPGRRKNAAVP